MAENVFDSSIQKTNLILKDIEKEFEWMEGPHSASSLLRAVLQTLRDRLTIDEAANFAAQLPTILRGVFYEGWQPSKVPIKFNKDEFIGEIERKFPTSPNISTEKMIRIVLKVLADHMSGEEITNLKLLLPKEFEIFFS